MDFIVILKEIGKKSIKIFEEIKEGDVENYTAQKVSL